MRRLGLTFCFLVLSQIAMAQGVYVHGSREGYNTLNRSLPKSLWDDCVLWVEGMTPVVADGTINAVYLDLSPEGNDGAQTTVANQPTRTVDGDGAYFDFDGTNDYIGVDDSASLAGYTEVTWTCWVKRDSWTLVGGLITKYVVADNDRGFTVSETDLADHSVLSYSFSSNGITKQRLYSPTGFFVNDVWTHVAVVFHNGDITIAKNGAVFTEDVSTQKTIYDNSASLEIGGYVNALHYFDGKIDSVQIFNRALTTNEISAIYNATMKWHPNP